MESLNLKLMEIFGNVKVKDANHNVEEYTLTFNEWEWTVVWAASGKRKEEIARQVPPFNYGLGVIEPERNISVKGSFSFEEDDVSCWEDVKKNNS